MELNAGLTTLKRIKVPEVCAGATHAYYVCGLTLDVDALGVSRERITEALRAEGVPSVLDWYQNLHLLPLLRYKSAYGAKGFPWNSLYCINDILYGLGLCPVAERLRSWSFLGLLICMNELPSEDVQLINEAFARSGARWTA